MSESNQKERNNAALEKVASNPANKSDRLSQQEQQSTSSSSKVACKFLLFHYFILRGIFYDYCFDLKSRAVSRKPRTKKKSQ
jgi:hypothetical protein